ncbi:antitoxin HicB [Rhodobium orientis]|uniref:HicB family protein n=1 Tax=Rhodobium orientis TaxID=34017 RepID=A0A327JKQ9_9HYPH|nr:type II toxin-antitoxin system HicB family antitoxin [Rhodobium orientis]MBB4301322.1 antitoxin HicB [Rhodobium orientis]MBK5951089.1 hypothetical protein [Rhodobium orientis]RAI26877.1 hypothetical protein CH339_12475 [Rhodobium orientis]
MDDNETFFVTSPDFPEVATFGEDLDSAMCNGRNALEEAIAARIAAKQRIPVPHPEDASQYTVQLPALTWLKTVLYMLCFEQNVSRAELQRRLGWKHREQVDRLFKLDHGTGLDQMDLALKAVGCDLFGRMDIRWDEAA